MTMQSDEIIGTLSEDWARVRRCELYALLDNLTMMQMCLVSLWDPDATVNPLTPMKRLQARDALHAAITDLTKWLEQEHSTVER